MNLGDLLPVFAATDAAAASAERNGKFTEFPDEEPTVKQMNDWLEVNLPVITKSHGELMRVQVRSPAAAREAELAGSSGVSRVARRARRLAGGIDRQARR